MVEEGEKYICIVDKTSKISINGHKLTKGQKVKITFSNIRYVEFDDMKYIFEKQDVIDMIYDEEIIEISEYRKYKLKKYLSR